MALYSVTYNRPDPHMREVKSVHVDCETGGQLFTVVTQTSHLKRWRMIHHRMNVDIFNEKDNCCYGKR
jgi:hypothetical protein